MTSTPAAVQFSVVSRGTGPSGAITYIMRLGIAMPGEQKKVVIVGQGYVGLPVAMRAVAAGYSVVGVDVDKRRVDDLAAGRSYVDDIGEEELQAALSSGHYLPTVDYNDAAGFQVAVITVPTPLKESLPDLSFIEDSARSLATHMTAGCTVILESTTYPGTTEELLVPILEAGSGLKVGREFFAGYSPERIDPGNKIWGFVETPKVVSGVDAVSLIEVRAFYDSLVNETVPVSGTREAELTKLLENTFRHVNIALVNELAIYAHQLGVNVWESIEAASSKPFGYMKFTPGPGVGGHCLPVDPSYLSWQVRRKLGQSFRFVELANDINDHMPDYVTQRLMLMLNRQQRSLSGSTILLVGLAYKKNTGDIRESPSLRLIDLLLDSGAHLLAVDDHIEDHRWPAGVTKVALSQTTLDSADIGVLLTDHDSVDHSLLVSGSMPLLDTKNRLVAEHIDRL
jgi:nucleotide sugar dehydrogenase